MKKLMGIPGEEGYSMPGEFEPHRGCIMIWPKRPGSWNYGAVKAREAFKNVAHAIAESEDVYMLAEPDVAEACCLVLLASDNMMLQCIQGYGRRGPGCCCYV